MPVGHRGHRQGGQRRSISHHRRQMGAGQHLSTCTIQPGEAGGAEGRRTARSLGCPGPCSPTRAGIRCSAGGASIASTTTALVFRSPGGRRRITLTPGVRSMEMQMPWGADVGDGLLTSAPPLWAQRKHESAVACRDAPGLAGRLPVVQQPWPTRPCSASVRAVLYSGCGTNSARGPGAMDCRH